MAATRDEDLRRMLADLVAGFRRSLADWQAEHGQPAPAETAMVLVATLDGFVLHKSLDPQLSAEAIRPVLYRLLTQRDHIA